MALQCGKKSCTQYTKPDKKGVHNCRTWAWHIPIDCGFIEATEKPAPSGQAESAGCTAEIEALKNLCKELLDGADKCSQEPHYIVQPFLGIVKRHAATITKYDLI